MPQQLSAASQKLLNSLPVDQRAGVRRRLRALESELSAHMIASRALIEANERGGANGGSTDWSDIDTAVGYAKKALGKKEVIQIRKDVYEAEGADLDDAELDEDEFDDED